MRCKCGFENAADARFCGNCRAALGDAPVSAVPNTGSSSTAPPVAAGGGRAGARPFSRAHIAVVAALIAVVAAGYWWLNRPPGRYRPDNSGLYPMDLNGKYGFIDKSGKTVIAPQFEEAGEFADGLAWIRQGSRSGYINTKGVVVINPQFEVAWSFAYGRAAVKLCCGPSERNRGNDRFAFIDEGGKFISAPDFTWVGPRFSGNLAPVKESTGTLAFIDRSGKVVLPSKWDTVRGTGFSAGLAAVAVGGKWGYIDTTGKWSINPQFDLAGDFADGLAPVTIAGKVGYIDKDGKFIVNPQYDSGAEFYEGLAAVGNEQRFGYIDTKGKQVIDLKYRWAGNFSYGLAGVRINDGWGGWGYIDRTGKVMIAPQFELAMAFQGELARVAADGRTTYVNKSGTIVVDPFLAELSHVDAAYREMIKGWLKRNRRFGALATMADCTVCKRGEAWGAAKGEDFWDNKHPYYAVGDFNKDGQTDVAIVSKTGDLVIFNGPLRVDSNGQWVGNIVCGRATGMGQCGSDASGSYLYYKAQKDMFICGSYGTEVSCSVKPSGDGYLFHP